jgi:hypothetical protein
MGFDIRIGAIGFNGIPAIGAIDRIGVDAIRTPIFGVLRICFNFRARFG